MLLVENHQDRLLGGFPHRPDASASSGLNLLASDMPVIR
jgi:hypothetical protein